MLLLLSARVVDELPADPSVVLLQAALGNERHLPSSLPQLVRPCLRIAAQDVLADLRQIRNEKKPISGAAQLYGPF